MVCFVSQEGNACHERKRGGEVLELELPYDGVAQPCGQSITLRGIEHDKAFEERNGTGFNLRAFSLLAPIFWGEAVGIEHCMPALAFVNASASGQSLPEGQPVLRRVSAFNDRTPQDQNIDARIGSARNSVAG